MTTNTLHAAITFSTEEYAQRIMGDLFGFTVIKAFDVGAELCQALFAFERGARLIQYDAGDAAIEVFIDPDRPSPRGRFDHLCFEVDEMDAFLDRAVSMGLEVRRFFTGAKDVVFIRDEDDNLYEIKPKA